MFAKPNGTILMVLCSESELLFAKIKTLGKAGSMIFTQSLSRLHISCSSPWGHPMALLQPKRTTGRRKRTKDSFRS